MAKQTYTKEEIEAAISKAFEETEFDGSSQYWCDSYERTFD